MGYFIKEAYNKPDKNLVISYKGESLNLMGKKITMGVPGNRNHPPSKKVVKGATQKELKDLYENPDIYGDFSHIIGFEKTKKISSE